MEYWPSLSELYIGHISMLWNTDPGSLNYSWVTFLCYGILTQALWIIAGSHFYAMEYWPSLSELYIGHISMLWNTDPGSLNYSWVTFLCHGILTQALWIIIAKWYFYDMEYWPRLPELRLGHIYMLWNIDPGSLNYSWVTFLCYGLLTQALCTIAGSHFYAVEYWPWDLDPVTKNNRLHRVFHDIK